MIVDTLFPIRYSLVRAHVQFNSVYGFRDKEVLAGFHKGDIVRVKGRYVKQIKSIYSTGRLAFKRIKGEPSAASPKDCQLLERGRTILWKRVV